MKDRVISYCALLVSLVSLGYAAWLHQQMTNLAHQQEAELWLPSESTLKKIQSDYEAALADATNSIPYAAEFAPLFPGAASFFSYYIGGAGSPTQLAPAAICS